MILTTTNHLIWNATKELVQEDIETLLDTILGNSCRLVVHNDEVNTFDWVIKSLIEVCKHKPKQAEQCAIIIHCQGKYAVKEGNEKELKPMREALVDRGIAATLEYESE